MKKNIKKWLSVLLAVVMLVASLPLIAGAVTPAPTSGNTSVSSGDSPLRVEITANRARYTLLGRMQFTATITNVSNETVNNISAEALFGADLRPLARGSTFTAERTSLAPNESFSFTYNARLSGLRSLDNLLLPLHWISSLFQGGTVNLDDNGFNDGRLFVQARHSVGIISFFSGQYEASTTVRVFFGNEEIYIPLLNSENISLSEYGWRYINNQLIFFAEADIPRAEVETIVERINASIVGTMSPVNFYQIQFSVAKSVEELRAIISHLNELPQIISAHINFVFERQSDGGPDYYIPNDPWNGAVWNTPPSDEYIPSGENWGIEKISAPYAWYHRNSFQSVNVGGHR